MAAGSGLVGNRLDDLQQLFAAIALTASEGDELSCSGHDCAALACSGDRDSAATSELEQPFVAKQAHCTEDGVSVHAEHRAEITRRRQALAWASLSLADRTAQLGRDLLVQPNRLVAIDLDLEQGASDNSFI